MWKNMKKLSLILAVLLFIAALPASAPGSAGDDTIKKMLPAFGSLIYAMYDMNAAYDPRDPDFFWTAIFNMAANWESLNPIAEVTEWTSFTLPVQTVREMASALFADYEGLPDVPESVSELVSYDEPLGVYRFPLFYVGCMYTKIDASMNASDGCVFVTAILMSFGEPTIGQKDQFMGRYEFIIQPNAHAAAIDEPKYLYSVVSAGRS